MIGVPVTQKVGICVIHLSTYSCFLCYFLFNNVIFTNILEIVQQSVISQLSRIWICAVIVTVMTNLFTSIAAYNLEWCYIVIQANKSLFQKRSVRDPYKRVLCIDCVIHMLKVCISSAHLLSL